MSVETHPAAPAALTAEGGRTNACSPSISTAKSNNAAGRAITGCGMQVFTAEGPFAGPPLTEKMASVSVCVVR